MLTSNKRRWILGSIAGLLLLLLGGAGWVYWQLQASLPQLVGKAALAGLLQPVEVVRDAAGVPTIRAQNRLDAARALGFLHAQERFFQMDLLRRSAAGELAELFGEAALAKDKSVRLQRFRARARRALNNVLGAAERQLLDAYTGGANSGLIQLSARPFEYLLLRTTPRPWAAEDCLLIIYAMYLDLQDEQGQMDSLRGLLSDFLPEALYRFFTPAGSAWDAPLTGAPFAQAPPPPAEIFNLREQTRELLLAQNQPSRFNPAAETALGSNNWAVAGDHTRHGGALLSNDMHLGLRQPNIWFRAALVFNDEQAQTWQVTGVTLPGVPFVVAGSNGHIAWGFTNTYGDWVDLVELETPSDTTYLTPDGPQAFSRSEEKIIVNNQPDETLIIKETIWGPVIDTDHRGRQRALRWIAHDREGLNLQQARLETARNTDAAMAIASLAGSPAQNLVVADSNGQIGWTILGPIPRRFGFDGQRPRSWADGRAGWNGILSPAEYPRIVSPSSGRIWTANGRVVDGDDLAKIGNGNYALGARAQQIRDALFALDEADEQAVLEIQLDDRALVYQRWGGLLVNLLQPALLSERPLRQEFREILLSWNGRASVDAVGYYLIRQFRLALARHLGEPLNALLQQADERADYGIFKQWEGVVWELLKTQPLHFLNPRFDSWQALLLSTIDEVITELTAAGTKLSAHRWGEQNIVHIQHPFSRLLPFLSTWLDMPAQPLPGGIHMPRVQTFKSGASQRMTVSPGREEQGIFHMPGGQSGHPLSPYYRTGHDAWTRGTASPFLPGPVRYHLVLQNQ